MSRARHSAKKRADGGSASGIPYKKSVKPDDAPVKEAYDAGTSETVKGAKDHTIGTITGKGATKRMDRKRGGAAKKVEKRATGGRVKGADMDPYSSAHKKGGKVEHRGR